MSATSSHPTAAPRPNSWSAVPWQLWVVILMLAIEGVGDLMLALDHNLAAASWLAAKIFFTLGFLYRWKLVYVVFLIIGALHVFGFSTQAPFIAFLNLVLVLLVASTLRYFFPVPQH
jgi:hypothetical protein